MSKKRKFEFAHVFSIVVGSVVAILVLTVGIELYGSGPPKPDSDSSPYPQVLIHGSPDRDAFYDITIDYSYAGTVYHKTAAYHCFVYTNPANSSKNGIGRWPGIAARLPDGSAAFFQFRQNICDENQLSRLVLGYEGMLHLFGKDLGYNPYSPWDVPGSVSGASGHGDQPDTPGTPTFGMKKYQNWIEFNFWASAHPKIFVTPSIYWLDNATNPTRIELCGPISCVTSPRARVQFLGIHASISTAKEETSPFVDAPGLKDIRDRAEPFLGYACWKIPLSLTKTVPELGLLFEEDLGVDAKTGAKQVWTNTEKIANSRHALGNFGAVQGFGVPFLNTQIGNGFGYFRPMDDDNFRNDGMPWKFETGEGLWRRHSELMPVADTLRVACKRSGDTMIIGQSVVDETTPVELTPILKSNIWPTNWPLQFALPSGRTIEVEPPNGFFKRTREDLNPTDGLFAAAYDSDRTVYIAEPTLMSMAQPRR